MKLNPPYSALMTRRYDFYRYGISLRMFFVSAADTSAEWRSRLLRFFPLLDSK
jgi:hypothetical protein